jgi:glycosyltransferase involved in cell wall biosynthesis
MDRSNRQDAPAPDADTRAGVSVIIPLGADGRLLKRFVRRSAGQGRSSDEIVIVGDQAGVPDWCAEALGCPVRFVPSGLQGWAALANLGVAHATGDRLAFGAPDRDPRTSHDPIEWTLTEEALIDWGCTGTDTDGLPAAILPEGARSALVISRRAFETAGGFDEDLGSYAMDDLLLRLFDAGGDHACLPGGVGTQAPRFGEEAPATDAVSLLRFFGKALAGARRGYPPEPLRDALVARGLREASRQLRQALSTGDRAAVAAWHAARSELQDLLATAGTCPLRPDRPIITAIVIECPNRQPPVPPSGVTGSAHRCLAEQTLQPDEIITVSSDAVPATALEADPRTTSLRMTWQTRAAARNLGFSHAHGDLIAFLDDGYEWRSDFLSTLVANVGDDGNWGWTHVDTEAVNPDGSLHRRCLLAAAAASHETDRPIRGWITKGVDIAVSAALISRAAIEAVGGFDVRLARFDGEDFFIRVARAGFGHTTSSRPLVRRLADETQGAPVIEGAERILFAEKLEAAFGDGAGVDDGAGGISRIAQRFANDVVADLRAALVTGDEPRIDALTAELRHFDASLIRIRGTAVPARMPLITAVIPLYNGAPYIAEALESVFAQSRRPDEVIVVDDGSTDDGPRIVAGLAARWPIRLLHQANGGQSAARNCGIRASHGDLIALLDQDDVWYPDHLARLAEPFLRDGQAPLGWAYSDLDEIDERGEMVCREVIRAHRKPDHPKRDLMSCLKEDMFILPSASLIAKHAIDAVGGFNERLSGYEDDDLFLRLFRAGYRNEFIGAALSKWRIYQTSSSYSPRMAASRLIYTQLLLDRFPDNPAGSRYYVSDVIAPRFLRTMAVDFRRCALSGDRQQQRVTLDHLAFIVNYLRGYRRIPMRYVVIPLLRLPVVAQFVLRHRLPVRALLRGLI